MWIKSGTGGVCHYMVADVAKAAARDLYERVMGDNGVRREWKKQNPGADEDLLIERFVDKNWGKCIEFAKHSMALMLNRSDLDERMKDLIMDALIKDNEVSKSRRDYRERMN